MVTETNFTLTEYKKNYNRLRGEFVNSYEDNDEEEFISLQIEWYKRCLENTRFEHGFLADTIGWFPKSMLQGVDQIYTVTDRIVIDFGEIDQKAAQNLSVSFSKIIRFLENIRKGTEKLNSVSPGQLALYYFILHELKLVPRFHQKVKEIEEISEVYKVNAKNFQLKYNEISRTGGQEGYTTKDVDVVNHLLSAKYPEAKNYLEKITHHIY